MICYDGPWIQWLFCDWSTMLEWGSRSNVGHLILDSVGLLVYDCTCTYPRHQCCITGLSKQRKPCLEGVNILGTLYDVKLWHDPLVLSIYYIYIASMSILQNVKLWLHIDACDLYINTQLHHMITCILYVLLLTKSWTSLQK